MILFTIVALHVCILLWLHRRALNANRAGIQRWSGAAAVPGYALSRECAAALITRTDGDVLGRRG